MDINRLPALFSSIADKVAGNNSNATKQENFLRNVSDSFVSSSVGQALAQRYSPEIPVGKAAQALADVFKQAA
jgi:hypothetical protein